MFNSVSEMASTVILLRSAEKRHGPMSASNHRVKTSQALSPRKLWAMLATKRGFISMPNKKGGPDAYRKSPATLPADVEGKGHPVGRGHETFAFVQLLNTDGERVGDLGFGYCRGGGDTHAEVKAVNGLSRHT